MIAVDRGNIKKQIRYNQQLRCLMILILNPEKEAVTLADQEG